MNINNRGLFLDDNIAFLSDTQIKPARDFTSDQYAVFLELAKPYELETDTVSKETLKQIYKQTNTQPKYESIY